MRLNKLHKKIAATTLIFLLVIGFTTQPFNHKLEVKEAEAQRAVTIVGCRAAWCAQMAGTNAAIATASGANAAANITLLQKEAWYDGIFGMLAKAFLRQVVNSIVNWINSGFQGSPAFVTDLDGFLRNVADEAIGQFIYEDPALNFLCSPFQLDVKIALAIQYSESRAGNYQPQCTLSNVAGNVENFMSGSFSDGGWPGMIEVVQNPVNNPIGATLSAQSEAYVRIIDAQGRELTKLDFGDGFFSMEICDVADQQSGAAPNCTIGTPGSVIANSINKALGAPQDELIAADEINEIFNALFSQLAQQAISGVFGLLGLGGSNTGYSDNRYGFDGGSSYLEAVLEAEASTTVDTSFYGNQSPIADSLAAEQSYVILLNEAIVRVDDAENDYREAESSLESQSCTISFSFPTAIEDYGIDAESKLPISQTVVNILTSLETALTNATTLEEQQDIARQYQDLQSQGLFRTETDNVIYELSIDNELVVAIDDMDAQIQADQTRCNQQNN